ncbi:MAG: YraN family protein [Rhizobium sp.]|nr:YraN family protein [Rhizobium sp.]
MPARPEKRATGDAAEAAARGLLEGEGLRLIARNVNYRFGELDLVMRDGDTVAFVEVRYRADDRYGGGLASVDRRKCRRIALAARAWLQRHPALADAPCRFDIVAASPAGLEWHRGAFTLDDL